MIPVASGGGPSNSGSVRSARSKSIFLKNFQNFPGVVREARVPFSMILRRSELKLEKKYDQKSALGDFGIFPALVVAHWCFLMVFIVSGVRNQK